MKINTVLFLALSTLLPFSCQISGTEECPEITKFNLSSQAVDNYITKNKLTLLFKSDTLIDTLYLDNYANVYSREDERNNCTKFESYTLYFKSAHLFSLEHKRLVLQTNGRQMDESVCFFPCSNKNCFEHLSNEGLYETPPTNKTNLDEFAIADTIYQNITKISYVLDEADYQLYFSENGHLIRIVDPNHTWDLVERL